MSNLLRRNPPRKSAAPQKTGKPDFALFLAFRARLRSTTVFDSVERAMPTPLPRFLAVLWLAVWALPAAAGVLAVTDSRHPLRTISIAWVESGTR